MDLLIISGFLGSGKTTLLRHIASEFAARYPSRKMAIIENEVGKIGIDGEFLKNDDLLVREINSGCICCSLRVDLIQTLLELEREYNPDLVILEPSGVAGPKQLMQSLVGYSGQIDNKRIISVIDASRISKLPKLTIPIVSDGILIADNIVINKIDLVDVYELENVRKKIEDIRPQAPIIEISAINKNVDDFLDLAFSVDYSDRDYEAISKEPLADTSTVTNATVHAVEVPVEFGEDVDFERIKDDFTELLQKIASRLQDAGCSMIGHLKAIVKTDKQGLLLVSTTSFEHKPHAKGMLKSGIKEAKLTINAIVYDIDSKVLGDLIQTELATIAY